MDKSITELSEVLHEYNRMGIHEQIDYQKFYLYSIITHSTAIEGSTVTEVENMLLFDEGISAKGKPMVEQLMNLDLKRAYEQSIAWAKEHKSFSVDMLKSLSALVMHNTGSSYSTLMGEFDSSKGDLRLVGVTAGPGGRSYMNFQKVPAKLEEFCRKINERRTSLLTSPNIIDAYLLSFDAHNMLVTIHPWVDGNGRMARLIMNHLQFEFGLIPSKVIQDDKAEYIEALNLSREEDSMIPFRLFMLKEHTRNLKKEIEEYKKSINEDFNFGGNEVDQNGGPETKKVDQKGGPNTRKAILKLISENDSVTSREMAAKLGINRSAISKHLKKMQEDNVIRREGSQKSGRWIIIKN
ncbi:MAG: Fic family protein [Prevotella sp.]